MSDEKYSGTWLTPDKIGQLTELKPTSYKAQCRRLAIMGVPFRPNAIGRPLVERAAVLTSHRTAKQARARTEPNWEAIIPRKLKP